MFGNNGMQFAPQDLAQLALVGGLSMLGNNNGNRSVGQLIGQGGLDALAGFQARKQYEAAMQRQQMLDERAQAQHDLQMRRGQMELAEANRKAALVKRWQAGDKSVYPYLFPEQWAADQRQARARAAAGKTGGSQTPTVAPQGGIDWSSPFGKELDKQYAKMYSELQAASRGGTEFDSSLDSAERALARGIYTGFGGEKIQTLRELGGAVGLANPEDVAAGEDLRKVQNVMALIIRNPEQGMGMPGAVSDKDIEFLKSMQVGLNRSPKANALFLRAARAIQQRKKDIAKMATAYVIKNGRLTPAFDAEVAAWAEANPLFADWEVNTKDDLGDMKLPVKDSGVYRSAADHADALIKKYKLR